jgi:hypothetical protein
MATGECETSGIYKQQRRHGHARHVAVSIYIYIKQVGVGSRRRMCRSTIHYTVHTDKGNYLLASQEMPCTACPWPGRQGSEREIEVN